MVTFDFETEGIVGNPIANPPRPVGVAIKYDDKPATYLAWGHPHGNNTTWEKGKLALINALKKDSNWLAHNAAFEAAVLRKWFGIRKGNPTKFHDTQYLIFLADPYANSFSLKPSAERLLGMAPEEQEEVRDWLLANQPMEEHGIKLGMGKDETATRHFWARYICMAPGELVGRYAIGDVDRTYALFQELMPKIEQNGMTEAYQREQKLMPILSESSERGILLNRGLLEEDIAIYEAARTGAEDYIFGELGEFELSKDAQLIAALEKADMVTEWVLTPTGRRSTSRKNLAGRIKDPMLMRCLSYHGIITTCLGTFGNPWLRLSAADGRLHPQWNQVRGDRGANVNGTRTGRMSCKEPNFQNIPNDFEGVEVPDFITKWFEEEYPSVPTIPHMRRYILPEDGMIWLKRDFSAQEMRILAHFAEGSLYDEYKRDATIDPHSVVGALIKRITGIDLPRKYVKITGFGIMYGRGIPNLSAALGIPVEEGKRVRDAYFAALPEVRELSYDTRNRGRRGDAIRTWGGRMYYREPNLERDLSYKLLNYLIQGSAADQTKQAIIDWNATRGKDDILLAAVHDEINICAPVDQKHEAMGRLRTAMDMDRFDVPFRSEGFHGFNWADIEKEKYDE